MAFPIPNGVSMHGMPCPALLALSIHLFFLSPFLFHLFFLKITLFSVCVDVHVTVRRCRWEGHLQKLALLFVPRGFPGWPTGLQARWQALT